MHTRDQDSQFYNSEHLRFRVNFRQHILAFWGGQCKSQETPSLGAAKVPNSHVCAEGNNTQWFSFFWLCTMLCPREGKRDSFVSFSVCHFEIICVPLVGSRSSLSWKCLLQGEIFNGANESQAVGSCLPSLERRHLPPKFRVANLPSEMTLLETCKCCCHWA